MRRTDILERKDEILEWIKEDLPNAEIARRLKCKVDTLKSYYTKMGITYSGNMSGKGIKGSSKERKSAEELAKSPTVGSHRLKLRLLEDPIVFRATKVGIVIVSMWGEEASDSMFDKYR